MPIIPAMAAIGTAMGASAGAAVAVGTVATVTTVGSVAAQGYSMYQNNKAAKNSAALVKDVGEYNAAVDLADAKQIELDTEQNTREMRREAAIFTSRQKAAYATSGVLMSGSPLSVVAESAGRLEQQVLQERLYAQREVTKRETAARIGVKYADSQASGILKQNRVNMFKGGIGILSTVASAYTSGMFSGAGAGTSLSSGGSAAMLASGAPAGLAFRAG